ncbi:early growth response protein 1 (egr-1) [Diplodia corticola]|uniref:Early growth response protein 1 (Egr-1) n=1 Tax=Diplodia corticola TaxID=236234 RepID=A0A1J9QVS0_9PEZI|nr:early growth response protein 1 (egr-1) [Diplodia corticola]OJD32512.1 early growth response protein 1 (egr-1) [Diplodia corticola]
MILPAVPWQSIEDEFCLPSTQILDTDDADLYLGLNALPVKRVTPDCQHCEAFFRKFHPTMPIMHEPTFEVAKAPKPLLTAVRCIGSLYGSAESRFAASRKFFEDGYYELEEYTREDRSRFQETWVLQAYVLLETYGIYICDDSLLSKAQNIHQTLVSAIRELQMTHDGHASRLGSPASPSPVSALSENDAGTLQKRWLDFIREESRKRSIYSIYLLDSQLSIACNLRPQISALEIKYALPSADDLWSAPTPTAWHRTRTHHFTSFNERDDAFAADEAKPSEGSLHGSTQDLLLLAHNSASSPPEHPTPDDATATPLRLLWYSPFAALVLVTQLHMTARELTHASCLLSRPASAGASAGPGAAHRHRGQRPLSILTEAQHGQISQALRSIAELVPPPPPAPARTATGTRGDAAAAGGRDATAATPTNGGGGSGGGGVAGPFEALWHSVHVALHHTSMTLSHPDALLVTGIVEPNLPAAIATAGHLARPRGRKANRDVYEDRDVFRILRDLEGGLGRLLGGGEEGQERERGENPFVTLLAFKICLVGWRIVRLTMGEAAGKGGRGEGLARYNPSRFVLQSIMAAIGKEDGLDGAGEGGDGGDVLEAEVVYLRWVREALMKRSVWPVGRWEAAIVEEALTGAVEYAAGVRECGGVM